MYIPELGVVSGSYLYYFMYVCVCVISTQVGFNKYILVNGARYIRH
jgi:hypothetical protein